MHNSWNDDQEFERQWHGTCANTFSEETKQISYAYRMGLVNEPKNGHWPCYDLKGISVVDIGGGPCSLLLKCINGGRRTVIDPCDYPTWVLQRYSEAGINVIRISGEDIVANTHVNEAWIYNCLQHTKDPQRIVRNARSIASVVRIFEWLNTPKTIGHPQTLRANELDEWLEGTGAIERMDGENGCHGLAYFGVFAGTA